MIISRIVGGIGNQMWQYAAGRRLAHKFNTEFKLHIQLDGKFTKYALGEFNITATIATPQEVKSIMEQRKDSAVVREGTKQVYDILDCSDDTYLWGYWEDERYFTDIADIIRKEFTLKNSLSEEAIHWRNKILSAECPVSMHFRHGDFLYNPNLQNMNIFARLPLDYYYECIKILQKQYKNITVFVFSNNMQWIKENLHLDVPTKFIEMPNQNIKDYSLSSPRDVEEIYLMSLCKHNIMANSTFGFWGAWLNQNPDKNVFMPMPSSFIGTKNVYRGFSAERNENSPLDSDKWIRVPFDLNNQPKVTMCPIFSLLVVVNNDAKTISKTLDSILNQDYKYYEIVIIDNASTDGSEKICRQAIAGKENVTFRKLWTKVKNAKAWNMALKMTRGGGYYVLFLKGNDRFFANTLTTLYYEVERTNLDIVHGFTWLVENESGNILFDDKKYSEQRDAKFIAAKNVVVSQDGKDATKLLFNRQINNFLGTKLYTRNFLWENGINFDEDLDGDEAELSFQMECFFKAKHLIYVPNVLYIEPTPKPLVADNIDAQIIDKFNHYLTARIDVKLVSTSSDFQIFSISDDKATVWKPKCLQENGIGYQIQSYARKLEFIAKATVNGELRIYLKGLDVRDEKDESKRIPYWIDYTKLTVNGKVIFDKLTPAWHDEFYRYNMDAKAGEEIKIQVEWLPNPKTILGVLD
ncbi:MAG: alpha-1,2-fucosyltransferase [Selenomonadaceae bacterium]|nr:alpha-1,2-fucosyltransferase [Selenomonadaceae bacterium]